MSKIETKNLKAQAIIQQKKDRIQEIIFESQQGRGRAQQKLSQLRFIIHKYFVSLKLPQRRSRDDEEEFRKINYEINNILKQRVAEQHKSIDIGKKVEKAQVTRVVQTKRIQSKHNKHTDESIYNYGFGK